MAEGLLFSVADGILGKLGSFASEEIGLWWGVNDEIGSLRRTVSRVKVVLLDAEDRQARGDDPVRDWLGELKEVIYDAEDLVDDFSTEVLRRQVTNEVRLFFSSSNRLAYGLKMGHKIKAIRKRLDAVMSEGEQFNFRQRLDTSTFVMAREREPTHSFLPGVVVGRADEKNAIKELLLSDNYETNVTVISIVGIGGMGKTTLAQLTYNDEYVRSRFDLKLWVCVSEDFNLKLIIEKILESLIGSKPNISEMDPLIRSLHEKINGKKYLLVLDDIWNEDFEKWCSLRDLLMGGSKGSRILITTRSNKVAEIANPRPEARYEVRGLSDKESWSLFAQKAFKEVTKYAPPTQSHEAIGKEIVAKCKGVPLAITAIGRVMYFKETIVEWEPFRSKELVTIDQGETNIMAALKLSYDVLPPHLKHCFAYCRLFPKDHIIDVDMLIDLWMTQGFIKSSDSTQCLEDIGRECFMDLLWRSFFQEFRRRWGNIILCKMHDLMHDLASSVAGAGSVCTSISNWREVSEKTQHLSVNRYVREDGDDWQVPVVVLEAKRLRTFLTPSLLYSTHYVNADRQCHAIFCNLRRLRQLDLLGLGNKTVPNSIGKLKQLRYLNLSWNMKIKILPRSISRLQNLQVLKLEGCDELRQLPKDIKKLVCLKKLDIYGCDNLTHMPRGIGQLTSLETLTRFVLPTSENSNRKSGGLGELRDLNKLGGDLWIENLPHRGNGKGNQKGTTPPTGVAETCAAANLSEKPRLQELVLRWAPLDDTDFNEDDVSLEALRPHPNLKSLTVQNYGGINFATWFSFLTSLVGLWLNNCPKCRSLPSLDQLPLLKGIYIRGLTDLEYIDISICSVGGTDICSSSSNNNSMISFFPSLELLRLYNCPNLKGWRPSSPSSLLPQFQHLSDLSTESCPNLTSMPPLYPSLKELTIGSVSFKSLEQMLKETISPAHEPSSSSLPSNLSSSLKELEINNIEHLPEDFLPVELLQTLTSLEKLSIRSCPTLTCLPHSKMLLLTSLKSLYIGICENLLDLSNYDDDSNSNNNDAILCQGQGLRSLTSLRIHKLPKLVHLPRRLLLHSIALQSLEISNCPDLASLPEWMPNLTSLQLLNIIDCSQLSERCKNSMGEDWPKIAHIPNIRVDWENIQGDGWHKKNPSTLPFPFQQEWRLGNLFMVSFPTSSARSMGFGGRKIGFCKDLITEIEKDQGLQGGASKDISCDYFFDLTSDFEVKREQKDADKGNLPKKSTEAGLVASSDDYCGPKQHPPILN